MRVDETAHLARRVRALERLADDIDLGVGGGTRGRGPPVGGGGRTRRGGQRHAHRGEEQRQNQQGSAPAERSSSPRHHSLLGRGNGPVDERARPSGAWADHDCVAGCHGWRKRCDENRFPGNASQQSGTDDLVRPGGGGGVEGSSTFCGRGGVVNARRMCGGCRHRAARAEGGARGRRRRPVAECAGTADGARRVPGRQRGGRTD